MKQKLIIILFLIVFQNSFSQSISRSEKYSIFSKENIDLKFKTIFLESLIKKNNDDINGAINLIKECLSIYPNSFSANYEIANLYYDLKDYETSLFYAQSALKVIPENFWVNNLLLKIYTELDDVVQILKTFKTILNIDYSIERKIKFAELNEYYSKPKSSIKIYNEIEKEIGVSEITSIKKQQLYINIGDIKSATKELKKLIDKFPNLIKYKIMLAKIYEANDLTEKALEIYNNIIKFDSTNIESNLSIAEIFRKKNDFINAYFYLNKCYYSNNFNTETSIYILKNYFDLGRANKINSKLFLNLTKKAIDFDNENYIIHSINGEINYFLNNISEAFSCYSKSISLGATDFNIWNKYLLLGLENKKYSQVSNDGANAIELFPIQPSIYLYTGLGSLLSENFVDAIEKLKTGLKYVINQPTIKSSFYQYLGDAYHSLKNDTLSDENYKMALIYNPNNSIVLNNYSYYLSLRSNQLSEAKKMSEKSLIIEPNNGTYMDTFAWILYKLKKYEEAELWIKKAMKNLTKVNSEIYEHCGDILFKLNKLDEAQKFWIKSQNSGNMSENIINKIKFKTINE
ncbi:MAG: hypothetical protein CBE48_002740 [Flavobacteriales bacterium TMED288]|nr:MAG: hypothetical protein CBE48_002740 [Flavobacteriales bacterium TMED288]